MRMKQWIVHYLEEELGRSATRRKKFDYASLESYLIHKRYKSQLQYQEDNGYNSLVIMMRELTEEGVIQPLKNSPKNGRFPAMPTTWWLLPPPLGDLWTDLQMLKVSDFLNLERYVQHPEWQTKEEWEQIEKIYHFFRHRNDRHWVSKQERALELFCQEKYFDTTAGRSILQRLQLSLEDLKANEYGEPFVFWPSMKCQPNLAKQILIVENLSFFHTCRYRMIHGKDILGYEPDMLIYGEGKKIEKSISFLKEIIQGQLVHLDYVGDIDPEGWGIYVRLKHRYPEFTFALAIPIYQAMIATDLVNDTETSQQESMDTLEEVLEEIGQKDDELAKKIEQLWKEKKRIPQETLTIETLSQKKGDEDEV